MLIIASIPVTQHSSREGVVADTVLFHWTAGTGDASRAAHYFNNLHDFDGEIRKPNGSYHRNVGREGDMVAMVDLDRAAWHAGDGDPDLWDGRADHPKPHQHINRRSIGVALCNRGPVGDGFEPYAEAQVAALRCLLVELVTRVPTLRYACGHQDITRRKGDPGPLFPWDDLGLADLGLVRVRRDWVANTWRAV